MTTVATFDPFHNRLCRDIRNALSISFIQALRQENVSPVIAVIEKFKAKSPAPFVTDYMNNRLMRYQEVMDDMTFRKISAADTYSVACSMWNRRLFFEFHEWLEDSWHSAAGSEKRMLQALIRSAGAYLLLEAGRKTGAQRLAAKAAAGLKEMQNSVPESFDVALLIDKLTALDSTPPRFAC